MQDMGNCCSASSGEGPNKFGHEVLSAHNGYRAKHAAPPLQWSREAAVAASRWAKRLASIGKLEHDRDSGMGQNLFQKTVVGSTLDVSGQEVVDAWYDEIRNYDFSRPGFSSATGHFTQVVWASSTHMGVATAMRGNTVFVVANYSPPGNIVGSQNFSVNVKKQT